MKTTLILASLLATNLAHADCSENMIRLAVKKLNQVNGTNDRKITLVETATEGKFSKTYEVSTIDANNDRYIYEVTTWSHRDGTCTIKKVEDLGET